MGEHLSVEGGGDRTPRTERRALRADASEMVDGHLAKVINLSGVPFADGLYRANAGSPARANPIVSQSILPTFVR
jgi:hypothetical protein